MRPARATASAARSSRASSRATIRSRRRVTRTSPRRCRRKAYGAVAPIPVRATVEQALAGDDPERRLACRMQGPVRRGRHASDVPSKQDQKRRREMQREVVVVSGVRTAIGDFGGASEGLRADRSRRTRRARSAVARERVGRRSRSRGVRQRRAYRAEGHVSRARRGDQRRRRAAHARADREPPVRLGLAGDRVGGAERSCSATPTSRSAAAPKT